MSPLTVDQVITLAPDPQSIQAAQKLTVVAKWPLLCKGRGEDRSDNALWGECQGSGSKPYQTRVDLSGPAYKCSCPSRKFPCKHALGLLLLYAESSSVFSEAEPPDWVAEWLAGRDQRAEKSANQAVKTADPDARRKRLAKRDQRIRQGIEELSLWLQDIIRTGLASAQSKPYHFWDSMAARMVDAQAPGLANRVRALASAFNSGELWNETVLKQLAQLHTLTTAYRQMDRLSPALQAEVRNQVGWTTPKEEVLATEPVSDHWQVWAQQLETDDDGLRTQRSWLFGEQHQRWAMVLNFAHGSRPLPASFIPGTRHTAQLCFYPAALPSRAVIKEQQSAPQALTTIDHHYTLANTLDRFANALSQQPWLEQLPTLISPALLIINEGNIVLYDADQRLIPCHCSSDHQWLLLTVSGGQPLCCFGLWDGRRLELLAVLSNQRYTPLL